MLRTTLAGLRARPGRLVATLLAVMLGVSFGCGTMIFGDTLKQSFFDQFAQAARNVDVVLLPPSKAGGAGPKPALPKELVPSAQAVPGVASVEGRYHAQLALLDRDGRVIRNGDQIGHAISAGVDPALRSYEIVAGRAPAAAGEAAVDEKTAQRAQLTVGTTITVLDADQQAHQLTVVGTCRLAASAQYSGYSVVALTDPQLAELARPTGYDEIVVRADPAVPPAVLADRLATAVAADGGPGEPEVVTGEQRRKNLAAQAVRDVDMLLLALSVFAFVALVVAAFVIFNTFTILLAQRTRELALLRCVGAGRRQIFGSVLLEATVVGLAGGLLGVAAGIGVAYSILKMFGWIGLSLPYRPPVLGVDAVAVALALGVAVTLLSAAVPAFRATRVAPLAALRTDLNAGIHSVRGRAVRMVLGGLTAAVGGLATIGGVLEPDPVASGGPNRAELLVIGGGMLVFLSLLILMPLFIGRFTALLGALPARWFGPPVKLAAANSRRNPVRAALTSATLAVGVGLMTVVSVLLASSSAAFEDQLTDQLPVDYAVAAGESDAGVPVEVLDTLRAREEFDLVVGMRTGPGMLGQRRATVGSVDRAGLGLLADTATGRLADLRPGRVVLAEIVAVKAGKQVGDEVTVTVDGRSASYQVVATVTQLPLDAAVLLDSEEYAQRFGEVGPDASLSVLLRAAPGVRSAESRAAVEAAVSAYPLLTVRSVADLREELTAQVNGLFGLFAGLLAVSLLIALVGIANTMSLSVVERTRESAVLRALGLTRGQLRATLLVEALLVASAGALTGVVFGLSYGALLTRVSFAGIDPKIVLPIGQNLAFVALAAGAGAVAAVLPAHRAQRLSIVTAMSVGD